MSIITNFSRAHWAAIAIEAFRAEVGRDDDATSTHDLVCDLGHYCRLNRLDFVAICSNAISTWCAEVDDPNGTRLDLGPEVSILVAGTKRQARAWLPRSTTAKRRPRKGGGQ